MKKRRTNALEESEDRKGSQQTAQRQRVQPSFDLLIAKVDLGQTKRYVDKLVLEAE